MTNKFQRSKYQILANLVFIVHLILVLVILFGWYITKIKYIYLWSLILTLISEVVFGFCLLTKWEFDLRKKIDPNLKYDYSFVSYYAYKYLGINPPKKLIKYLALIFLITSIILFYV